MPTMTAPTKSPNGGRSANFRRDVQVAFAKQRRETEKSFNGFVNTVAMLCEQSNVTGTVVAETLRELADPIQVSTSCDNSDCSTDDTYTSTSEKDLQAALKSELAQSSLNFDDNNEIEKSIMEEHQIKPLAFMGASGEIARQPSTIERMGGQRLKTMKQCLISPFEHCHPRTGRFADVVESLGFKMLTMVVICLNFVFIIVQSDYRASHLNQGESSTLAAIGYCFTVFYTLELCALMFVHGKQFFVGPEMGWNLFDSAIVFVALFDILMECLGIDGFNLSFLRVLRFFKISRVLRMFSALRAFKEIRIMVDALVGCLSIFLFCIGLLSIFLSVFAIFFVQGVSELLESGSNLDDDLVVDLQANWCSVSGAMLQLFMAITGGIDWSDAFNVVKEVGVMHACLFVFFVAFYYIAFFNVITSVFCEKAMSLATPTSSELIAKRIEKEHHDATELMSLLKRSLKQDSLHTINDEQIADFVNDPEVELYFDVRGLKSSSARKLYRMLCEVHCSDRIQIVEFISSLVKLDGAANGIDAHCLQVRQLHGLHQMKAVQKAHTKEMVGLRDSLKRMCQGDPVASEGHLFSPIRSYVMDPIAMARKAVPGERYCNDAVLPALPRMNDTLKLLKQVVHESIGASVVGNDALKIVKQLVPLCCNAAVPDQEFTLDTKVGANATFLKDEALEWSTDEPDAVKVTSIQQSICLELSQMQKTLNEIQQTLPASSTWATASV